MAVDACHGRIGMEFLRDLREIMGQDAWLAAVQELHAQFGPSTLYAAGSNAMRDPDIYDAFLRHSPSERVQQVGRVVREHARWSAGNNR